MTNAAIFMHPNAYETSGAALMGRHSAGESFVKGFIQHAAVDRFAFWNATSSTNATIETALNALSPIKRPVDWIARDDRGSLAKTGAIFMPVPSVGQEAWSRRHAGASAYSITGVTHTTCTHRILDTVAQLVLSPTQPWDALICTSRAVTASLEVELESLDAFLRERVGATKTPPIRLETIPLGLNTQDFSLQPKQRKAWRERLNIPETDIVVLYVGRFSANAKMNPIPMAMALEQAAKRTQKKIHWVQSGWSANDAADKAYHDSTRAYCPSVQYHVVDGRVPDTRFTIWSVADIFFSLSDNIQETFGLTPLEAMAAGLPSVVSDWDGYKDTVRHGVDGFRVSTYAPRPGMGGDLAYRYENNTTRYETYVGSASQFTAIDLDEAAQALLDLIENPSLRAHMGATARKRAQSVFDWKAVIPTYQALWGELAAIRASARTPLTTRAQAEYPWRLDPFQMFASYPTEHLMPTTIVSLVPGATNAALKAVLKSPLVAYAAGFFPVAHELDTLVFRLSGARQMRVSELMADVPASRRVRVERSILTLAKYGVVKIHARSLTIPQ